MSKAEQSQTVTSAVTISGSEVLLPYFPSMVSTSFHTQRLSAAEAVVDGVPGKNEQDLIVSKLNKSNNMGMIVHTN